MTGISIAVVVTFGLCLRVAVASAQTLSRYRDHIFGRRLAPVAAPAGARPGGASTRREPTDRDGWRP